MFPVNQRDPATGVGTGVTDDFEQCVITTPYPPLALQKVRPFRQYFTDDGLADGIKSMAVDGSVTSVDYFIPAHVSDDRYITSLNFIVGYGTTGKPFQWADGTGLTNGTRLFYNNNTGEYTIHDGIKTNQDMFRLSFNPIPTAWEVRHVNASNDFGYFISMDLKQMGLPFGIKLDGNTKQRLTIRIRDNVATDADSFDCIAYGFDRFK